MLENGFVDPKKHNPNDYITHTTNAAKRLEEALKGVKAHEAVAEIVAAMFDTGFELLGIGLIYSLGCLIVGIFALLQLLTLYAGWRAWEMDKTWIWILIALSALSMLNSGMLTMVSGVVTIVGCVQALQRQKTT